MGGAQLLVSNESNAPHVAVALDVPHVVTISNGNHFGRFVPYPKSMFRNYDIAFHPRINLNDDKIDSLVKRYEKESDLDISEVSPASVKKLLSKHKETLTRYESNE